MPLVYYAIAIVSQGIALASKLVAHSTREGSLGHGYHGITCVLEVVDNTFLFALHVVDILSLAVNFDFSYQTALSFVCRLRMKKKGPSFLHL